MRQNTARTAAETLHCRPRAVSRAGRKPAPRDALYAHVSADASRPLRLYTALSLDPPRPAAGLEGRFSGHR